VKKLFKMLLIPILILLLISRVQAATFSLFVSCIDETGIYFGYQADEPFQGSSSVVFFGGGEIIGDAPSNFEAGRHDRVFGVQIAAESAAHWEVTGDNWSQRIYVDGSTAAGPCPNDAWQPGAPSIYIPLESDCAFVEIQDTYGNWHRVESDGAAVLLHYGDSLIAGRSQSLDPADYRAVATACY
jgi:hypothetical protein